MIEQGGPDLEQYARSSEPVWSSQDGQLAPANEAAREAEAQGELAAHQYIRAAKAEEQAFAQEPVYVINNLDDDQQIAQKDLEGYLKSNDTHERRAA